MTAAGDMRLAAWAAAVPEGRMPVSEAVAAAGGGRGEATAFSRLFGIDTVAMAAPGAPRPHAALLDRLAREHDGPPPDIVLHVRGNPAAAGLEAADLAPQLAAHPFLAAARGVVEMDQHNCSTLFWALAAAGRMLAAGTARAVAILAGDGMSHGPLAERYAPGCTAIGDAHAGIVLDSCQGGPRLTAPWLAIRSAYHAGRFGPAEGVQAFNAALGALVGQILEGTGHDPARDTILGHNVNVMAWRGFCRETGHAPDRVDLGLLPEIGHCYTLDALLLLIRRLEADGPEAVARAGITLLSVGQGGFLGGCRLTAAPRIGGPCDAAA